MEDNSRGYNQRKYHQLRGAGELIEVHGGHIVRSTGRKDRHSKVFTAKGPRDRRVRLSAHTAIQFYDVQDRLGYDRPSKAVDWLIQNAKAAIDQLAEPSPCNGPSDQHSAREPSSMLDVKADLPVSYGSTAAGFLLPLDGETSMKSFSVAAVTGSSYENCTPDLLPSASSRAQDLSLSLQSFQEPIFQQAHHQHSHPDSTLHSFFSGTTSLVHGATPVSWPSHNERMLAFNAADAICGGGGGGEFAYNVAFSQHNQGQLTQREPLQSSNLSPVRAWMDPAAIQQSSFSSAAAAAGMFLPGGYGGFPGFDIPVRVQGEAEQGGIARKPHSATHQ